MRPYLLLLTGTICIGWSAIFVKLAGLPGPASAFWRVGIASAVLVPWWLWRGERRIQRRHAAAVCLSGALFAGDLVLWNAGLLHTTAASATLLANLSPLWVGLGAWIAFRRRLPARFWVGMAVALAGTLLVLGAPAAADGRLNPGDAMALGASFFYAAYLLATAETRRHVDTLTFMTLSTVSCAVVLAAMAFGTAAPMSGYTGAVWAALLGLGLISHLGGWLTINAALGRLEAPVVAVTLLGQPVFTTIFAAVVLSERPTQAQMAGGILVLVGIALVNLRLARGTAAPEPVLFPPPRA
jgi:drug/metabolite transporter (DMT)-like permease